MPQVYAAAVTAASSIPYGTDQAFESWRGFDGEFSVQQLPVGVVLPERIHRIPFGEVGADEDPPGALSQGVALDRCEPSLYRLSKSARVGQAGTDSFESVHPQLAESFARELDPVVVHVGQQVVGRRDDRKILGLGLAFLEHEPPGAGIDVAHIDKHSGRQLQVRGRGRDQEQPQLSEPPQGRPQARRRVRLGTVGPEGGCDMGASQAVLMNRQVSDQPLGAHRKVY
jgi:hypothetical protein